MSEGAEGLEKIIALEGRVDGIEKRIEKIDTNLQRVWERMDSHREGQIRTQTLVEVVDKNVAEVKLQMSKLAEAQQATFQKLSEENSSNKVNSASKWEAFFAKALWVAVGAVVSLILYFRIK